MMAFYFLDKHFSYCPIAQKIGSASNNQYHMKLITVLYPYSLCGFARDGAQISVFIYITMKHCWDIIALFPRRDALDKCKQFNLSVEVTLKLKIKVPNKFSINPKSRCPGVLHGT